MELRIAIVHDWLTGMRGGEKVLEVLCELFPQATLFTLLHNKGSMSPPIERMEIRTSFVQHLPLRKTKYRSYLPLFPRAVESFDFSPYDLIISSSHCVAKGARPRPAALHLCYCYTPMRYVWEMYETYFGAGRADPLTRGVMSVVAPRLRAWDVRTSDRVHSFVAISNYIAARIERHYQRPSTVIYPPVDTHQFSVSRSDKGYYLVVSALVPYKRVDLAVGAFRKLDEPLLVVGTGPEEKRLRRSAPPNVEFLGWQSDARLAELYGGCRALLFPGEEDFGIVPLEAMACGKPVIAFGRGGALETVVEGGTRPTGVFFGEQTEEALVAAIRRSETLSFDAEGIRLHAERFDRSRFKQTLGDFVRQKTQDFFRR